MSYNYLIERPKIFTEDGTRMLLQIRDNCTRLHALAGAFTYIHATKGVSGMSWLMLACLDYLCEIGELEALDHDPPMSQDQVYIWKGDRYE